MDVLVNLSELPAPLISSLSLIIFILLHSYGCVASSTRLNWLSKRIVVVYNVICVITNAYCLLYGLIEFEHHGSLRLNAFNSDLLYSYKFSKYLELLGLLLLCLCLCSHRVEFITFSNYLPMFIMADYCFKHCRLDPMCIVIIVNSIAQIFIHGSMIASLLFGSKGAVSRAPLFCPIIEYFIYIVISFLGYYNYEYSSLSVGLSIFVFIIIAIINCLVNEMQESK